MFFKTCCQRKENASVIPLMIALKTTISIRGGTEKKGKFPAMFAIQTMQSCALS